MFKFFKQLFCWHKWLLDKAGTFQYQKGIREKIVINGKLWVCSKCGKTKFTFS